MDGRIKELAKQAGGGPSKWYTDEDVLEYFAQLIVKECAGVCEEYRGTEWGKAAECIGDSIKEHFGVKE